MKFNKYLNIVLKKFYLMTHVPIRAFDYDGNALSSFGYNGKLTRIFESNDVHAKLENKDYDEDQHGNEYSIIRINNGINFIATPICPKNKHRGRFIIGPYTSHKKIANISFKPRSLTMYMISLLRIIWQDYPTDQYLNIDSEPYSYHIRKAIDYIQENYMDDIKLDTLTEYLDINKSYFCSIFKEETGFTFTQYLNKLRIEKSKELLVNENCSVLDVALNVGYNNQNYYNIMFKRITNSTPLEYRNENIS